MEKRQLSEQRGPTGDINELQIHVQDLNRVARSSASFVHINDHGTSPGSAENGRVSPPRSIRNRRDRDIPTTSPEEGRAPLLSNVQLLKASKRSSMERNRSRDV
eukprot:c28477_g1_i3 orf=1727-2038(-)